MATAPGTKVAKAKVAGVPALINFDDEMERLKARLKAPSGDRIKIKNRQFQFPDGQLFDSLDMVVVDFVHFNRYYENEYEEGVTVAPICFAYGDSEKTLIVSPNSIEAQSDKCASCALNQFGSKGAKGKACGNRILAALLPTDATESTPFLILDITPKALKPFTDYVHAVATAMRRPPYGVVSHIVSNPAVTYAMPLFSEPEKIEDPEFITMLRSRLGEARERLLVEPNIEALQAANDAPPKSKLPAPRKAAGRR